MVLLDYSGCKNENCKKKKKYIKIYIKYINIFEVLVEVICCCLTQSKIAGTKRTMFQ